MKAERTKKEVIITVPIGSMDLVELQAILDFARYKELISKVKKIDQKVIDKLASDINRKWWAKNRKRWIK